MTTERSTPPRWDLETIGPLPGSKDFAVAEERATAAIHRTTQFFDAHDIRGGDLLGCDDETAAVVGETIDVLNAAIAAVRELRAVVHGTVTTDARDDVAASTENRLRAELTTPLNILHARFDAWTQRLDVDALAARDTRIADHQYPLQRARAAADRQMSEPEEALAAQLAVTGSAGWVRLHADITGRIDASLRSSKRQGERLSMPSLRTLATDPDPEVRRAGFNAELEAWEQVAIPLAACLNNQKGESITLNRRRGWTDDLEPALFDNGIDRATLGAMTAEVADALPDFHRYLMAKARLLGHERALPWWDLLAPVSDDGAGIAWPEALDRVRNSFATYSSPLATLVDRASGEAWIDAEPRAGKKDGAYCMAVGDDVSRIMMTFDGSADAVQTLAHELGHAYHNTMLGSRTWLQRATPRCLAETASIFCETILVDRLLLEAPPADRLGLLDTDLVGATQVVVDIHSRYLFETELYRRRASTTLSVEELCDLMSECQAAAYGDAVTPTHPWMWAVKAHYFTPFYNFPYTFGLLFGLGLSAEYRAAPDRFRAGYDDLLSSTGLDDATALAGRFDIDIADRAFWRSSLDVLRGRIDEYCELASAD